MNEQVMADNNAPMCTRKHATHSNSCHLTFFSIQALPIAREVPLYKYLEFYFPHALQQIAIVTHRSVNLQSNHGY